MIKKILLLFAVTLITGSLFAQTRGNRGPGQAAVPPPVLYREVSGVVRDTADNTIIGAVITLTSRKDTLRTSTNADGVFVIKNVKIATFTLTVSSVGFVPTIRKYLQNDALKKLVLEPIELKADNHMMTEVKINGTPSIVYKVDTVEYKASDYHVRDNATLDELLKKMEGFEIGSDGTATHQGQAITKIKLNGKIYGTGDVATGIQNLPADIIEKIQVVDDYGDAAARTGIKDGDPQKVLNVTTKPDRSVGVTGRLTGQAGNDDRYNANLFVQRINANQQLGVVGGFRNTVNGVASAGVAGGATNGGGGGSGSRGGSSGTTQSGNPSFNYRDQWGPKVQVIAGYTYTFRNNNSMNISSGQNLSLQGPSNFSNNNTADNNSKSHTVNFQMEITPDSADFIQITPNFSYTNGVSSSTSDQDNINFYKNFSHTRDVGFSSATNSSPYNYGLVAFYQHLYKKPHRNISVQVSANRTSTDNNNESNKTRHYYLDSTQNTLLRDSVSHLITNRNSINTTYRASMTYVEPFSLTTQLEFNGQVRKSIYDNTSITDTVLASGQQYEIPLKDNISAYSFTEGRFTFNYRFNGIKWSLSLGSTLIPSVINGTKINSSTGVNVPTTHSDFKVIPVFRLGYQWSRTERFTLTYSGSNNEPTFTEIQSFTDVSNKSNFIYGNPDLKPSFINSVNAQYNNYIANSKLNFSFGINDSFTSNEINQDNINVALPPSYVTVITPKGPKLDTIQAYRNDQHYVNLNGANSIVGRYNIAKQLDDRRYNLSLNGNITYNYGVGQSGIGAIVGPNLVVSANELFHTTNWRFDERFGPRISPTDDIEINPYIGYDLSRTFTTLSLNKTNAATEVKTTSLAVDGRMYFLKTFQINYSMTKSYVAGLGSLSTNPLVINAGFQKEFFKKKNLTVTFNAFDILHQNNFTQQTVTNTSITNTQSNSLSRYFLVGFIVNLQKWSGSPKRNGKIMKRRGDGSFIYE